MINLDRRSGIAFSTDWKGAVETIKAAKQKRDHYLPIMTNAERQIVADDIGHLVEQSRPIIENGAIAAYNGAAIGVIQGQTKVQAEKKKILNSWDTSKLAAELQLYGLQVENALKNGDIETLSRIHQEAIDSGDRYKQRAAAETLQGLVNKFPQGKQDSHGLDARTLANRLENQAARDLASMGTSPELFKASSELDAKKQDLQNAEKQLYETAGLLGDLAFNGDMHNSRFIETMRSVTQDADGTFHTGEQS